MDELILVNEENISTINERLEKLYKLFSLDPYEEDLATGDSEIVIAFPDESEYIAYSIHYCPKKLPHRFS